MKRKPYEDDASLEKALSASARLMDAPEAVIQRAIQLMDAVRPAAQHASQATSSLSRVLAILRFDSASAPAVAFGQRSRGSSVRQLLYAVQGRDVDIRVAASGPDRFVVSGQVLGPDVEGQVRLTHRTSGDVLSGALSELGEFRIQDLPAGSYQVVLELKLLVASLPDLEIPHDSSSA